MAIDLGRQLLSSIQSYTAEKIALINEAVMDETEVMLDLVREDSPVRKKRNKDETDEAPGAYRKGWIKTNRKYKKSNYGAGRLYGIVRNKTDPGLGHLLEFGHAVKGGGKAKAIPHIQKANISVKSDLEVRIKEILED